MLLSQSLIDGNESLFVGYKRANHIRIKMRTGLGNDHRPGQIVVKGGLINPFGGEGIVNIRQATMRPQSGMWSPVSLAG